MALEDEAYSQDIVAQETELLGSYKESLSPQDLIKFNSAQKVWPLEENSSSDSGVWIGPALAAWPIVLSKWGITHVVCLTQDPSPAKADPHIKILHVPIDDEPTEDLLSHLKEVVAWIDDAVSTNGHVLVHCRAGRSRSAAVVAAFVMRATGCSSEAAVNAVKTARPFVKVNDGFEKQLKVFATSEENESSSGSPCDLCKLEKTTPWLEEEEEFAVLRCDQCDNPMIVWRRHTMLLSQRERQKMRRALAKHADQEFGPEGWYLDTQQRTISDHTHWHARPHTELTRLFEKMKQAKETSSRL